jgi:hypothetical protein
MAVPTKGPVNSTTPNSKVCETELFDRAIEIRTFSQATISATADTVIRSMNRTFPAKFKAPVALTSIDRNHVTLASCPTAQASASVLQI